LRRTQASKKSPLTRRIYAVLLSAMVLAPSVSHASESTEVWGEFRVTGAVNDALAFQTGSAVRYRTEPWDHYYTHMEIGFAWSASKHITLGVYYQHVNTGSGGAWTAESRPHVDATLTGALGWLRLRDRQRLEWRVTETDPSLRYRNKLAASLRGLSQRSVRPYVAFEPFYDLTEGELSKSRAYAGVEVGPWGPFSADLHYAYEGWKKGGGSDGVGIVGLAIKQRF
jgi:hypothetical protein